MQNSIWKLTTLAGVIGVGFLIVLQAQDGLNQDDKEQHALVPAEPTGPNSPVAGAPYEGSETPSWRPDESHWQNPDDLQGNVEPPIPEQSEPVFGPQSAGLASTGTSLPDASELPGLPAFTTEPSPADTPIEAPRIPDSPAGVVSIREPDFGPDPFAANATATEGNVAAALPEPGRLVNGPSLTSPTVVTSGRDRITDSSLLIEPVGNQVASLPDPPDSSQESNAGNLPSLSPPRGLPEFTPDVLPGLPEPLGPLPLPDTKPSTPLVADFAASRPAQDESPSAGEPAGELAQLPGLSPEDDPFGPTPDESAAQVSATDLELPGKLPEFDPDIRSASTETGVRSVSTAASVSGSTGTAEFPAEAPAATQRPELTIEKIAPPEATLGEPMIYSIRVMNRGDANAARVVVEDQVPEGCRLVGTIPQAELIGTKLLWRLGRLASGEQKKLLIKVVPIEEGDIGSIATVNFASEVATRTEVRQPAAPDLRVRVEAPPQASVGQAVVFSFEIQNTGQRDAKDVSLQNIIPVGFEHPAGKDLTYDIGTIPAGKSFQIDLELKAVKSGRHTNRSIVKTTGGADTESNATVEVVEQRGLKITAVADQSSVVGQRFVQRITVTNESTQRVSDGAVTLALARPLRFVSASNGGIHDKSQSTIQWGLPPIEPGQSVNVEAIAIAAQAGNHACQIKVSAPGRDSQTAQLMRIVRGIAALQLDLKDVPATVFPDDEFTVSVRLLNRGTGADSSVQFGLRVPSELEFVKALGPVKHLPPASAQGGRQISFKAIPEIGEGASVDFEITLRARTAGRPKLRAEVRSDQLAEPVASEAAVVVIDTAP